MIPHHSIAILTSERAELNDPRVRRLADEIIASQRREISEMKALIGEISTHGSGGEAARSVERILLGPEVPPADPGAASVPEGFRAEVVMTGLTYPTSVEFDDQGTMYVAESGYSYGDPGVVPRIVAVAPDGRVSVVAGEEALSAPVNDLLWHDGALYISHRGRISVLGSDGGVRDIITDLPSEGDHHNNQMTIGPDGKLYFGQGTATNSGVVGVDNYQMGWLRDHPEFHDVPARDIAVRDVVFETTSPLTDEGEQVRTLPFHAFGSGGEAGEIVRGSVKASGSILRMNTDGSGLEVYAWGLRNPYGVMWSPDGTLYATENGFDVRGSRPIANDLEDIYVVHEGAWYGWPDYAMGLPVTNPRFKPADKPQPQFLMREHPAVEQPWMNFPSHSAIAKVDFASGEPFGRGSMFVAFFGHMSPMTGEAPERHGGHRVLRIDPQTRAVEVFFTKSGHGSGGGHGGPETASDGAHGDQGARDQQNKPNEPSTDQGEREEHGETGGDSESGAKSGAHSDGSGGDHAGGQAHHESLTAGPRRLLDVRFSPAGDALYVVDFGAMIVEDKPRPVPRTGVIWRIVPEGVQPSAPPTGLATPESP